MKTFLNYLMNMKEIVIADSPLTSSPITKKANAVVYTPEPETMKKHFGKTWKSSEFTE